MDELLKAMETVLNKLNLAKISNKQLYPPGQINAE
jgi:hypothetical protein